MCSCIVILFHLKTFYVYRLTTTQVEIIFNICKNTVFVKKSSVEINLGLAPETQLKFDVEDAKLIFDSILSKIGNEKIQKPNRWGAITKNGGKTLTAVASSYFLENNDEVGPVRILPPNFMSRPSTAGTNWYVKNASPIGNI